MITSKDFVENFVEISDGARKSGKNIKFGHMEPGIENPGSTGRQNVHGHRFRVWHAFLDLQLRGFAKISRTAFQIALQTHLGVQKFESF